MSVRLTKRVVDALEPRAKKYDVYDAALPGFIVRVMPSGLKQFGVIYRAGTGRSAQKKRVKVGRFGTLTVDEARDHARKILADVTRGIDPAAVRNEAKTAPRVAELGVQWLADVEARRKPRTHETYSTLWRLYVAPKLGRFLVRDVTSAQVAALHHSLRDKLYTANRVLAVLGSFFTFAERQGARPRGTNPAHEVEPYTEKGRERFLTAEEFPRLIEAVERAEREGLPSAPKKRRKPSTGPKANRRPKGADVPRPANPFAIAALRFLMVSGWREQEALTLEWRAVDMEKRRVALGDTKAGPSKRLLSAPAVLLLADLPRVKGSPYVFPGSIPGQPLKDISRLWYAVRHAASIEDVRLHDLRHSFAAVIASAGGSLLMIAKLLGHKDSATAAKYAHLFDDPVHAVADAAAEQIIAWGAKGTPATVLSIASGDNGRRASVRK